MLYAKGNFNERKSGNEKECDKEFDESKECNKNEEFDESKECNKNEEFEENVESNEMKEYEELMKLEKWRFACEKCVSVFDDRKQVEEHIRNSNGVCNKARCIALINRSEKREYGCRMCNKTFDEKEKLDDHIRNNHLHFAVTSDESMFKKCMRCEMKFITKHSMEEHVRLVHPDVVSSSARRFGNEIEILPSGSLRKGNMD